jgi:hypothetical protein
MHVFGLFFVVVYRVHKDNVSEGGIKGHKPLRHKGDHHASYHMPYRNEENKIVFFSFFPFVNEQ